MRYKSGSNSLGRYKSGSNFVPGASDLEIGTWKRRETVAHAQSLVGVRLRFILNLFGRNSAIHTAEHIPVIKSQLASLN